MVYRLLALNIDGTLLKNGHRLDRETKEAIKYVKGKGVYVTFVTRRHFASAHKLAKALKLDSHLVTHGGAFVASSSDDPLYETRLSPELTAEIVKVLESFRCHIRIKHETFSVGNRVPEAQQLMAKMTIGDPFFYPVTFVEHLVDHIEKDEIAPPQIEAYFGSTQACLEADETLSTLFHGIHTSITEEGRLTIVPRAASKWHGLALLGDALKIDPAEMVAIGDGIDDLNMIEKVGLGVAMGNGHPMLRDRADWVTRSNQQDGVAYMVKEVFRKQMRFQVRFS